MATAREGSAKRGVSRKRGQQKERSAEREVSRKRGQQKERSE
jgi:hypothetical protein